MEGKNAGKKAAKKAMKKFPGKKNPGKKHGGKKVGAKKLPGKRALDIKAVVDASNDELKHVEGKKYVATKTVIPVELPHGTPPEDRALADTDSDGKVALVRTPKRPLSGQSVAEWEEQKVAAMEKLMHQGISDSATLNKLLDLSNDQGRRFRSRVKARWAALGTSSDPHEDLGKCRSYVEYMQNKLWLDYQNLPKNSVRERAFIVSLLMQLFQQQKELYGIDDKAVKRILTMSDDTEVMRRIGKNALLAEVTGKFADILQRQRQTAETEKEMGLHEAEIVE